MSDAVQQLAAIADKLSSKPLTGAVSVRSIADIILSDTRFAIWSGSGQPDKHHYGKGGLARHTLEVVELCLMNNGYFSDRVPPTKLYLAALFHDSGKMYDYAPTVHENYVDYSEWQPTRHKRIIHHIFRSAQIWIEAARALDSLFVDDVLHAILAHHGRREWGSPTSPASSLAWILHCCDMISARLDDVGRFDRQH